MYTQLSIPIIFKFYTSEHTGCCWPYRMLVNLLGLLLKAANWTGDW